MNTIDQRLLAAGMSDREASAKRQLFDRCAAALGTTPSAAFFVPGRIEVLGKHTDYAGGPSLLCAVERGFVVLVAPRGDARVRVRAVDDDTIAELLLDPELPVRQGEWSSYPATVVRRIARNFPGARTGADIAFASDLPQASGLSSSSALTIAIYLAVAEANQLSEHPVYRQEIQSEEDLAGFLGALENGLSFGSLPGDLGVGTMGGSEDHTAILYCHADTISHYSFFPVSFHGQIAMPPGTTFVVAYSGVAAPKTSSAMARYNEAAGAVRRMVAIWNKAMTRKDSCLADALASSPEAAVTLRDLLQSSNSIDFTAQRLVDRFDQYVLEAHDVIPEAFTALGDGDLDAFGRVVDRSQNAAETLLGNQIPETIELARSARELGAFAASAFGGGFGGSVWALVEKGDAEIFAERWRRVYEQAFPEAAANARFIVTAAGPAAMSILDQG